jgi:asparagine synthetase B (glutamine-hydrolysing)
VAVLFSGGLDSMILAALLDECLDPSCKCCSESYVYIFFSLLMFCVIFVHISMDLLELKLES